MRKYLSIISVCASLVVTSAYGLGGMVNSTISDTPFPFNVGSVVTTNNTPTQMGFQPVRPYLGFIAAHQDSMPTTLYTGTHFNNVWMACIAETPITNIQAYFANFYGNNETGTGGPLYVSAAISYSNVITSLQFAGGLNTNIPSGQMGCSLLTSCPLIPAGGLFYFRTFETNSAGTCSTANGTGPYDITGYGGTVDETTNTTYPSGTVGTGNYLMGPIAIVGNTTKASVLILGDSRDWGINDVNYFGNSGSIPTFCNGIGRLFVPYYGFCNLSIPSDRFLNYTGHTNRMYFTNFATVIWSDLFINELFNGAQTTAQQTATNFYQLFSQPVCVETVSPWATSSSDGYFTVANQVVNASDSYRTNFNYLARNHLLPNVIHVCDVAAITESSGINYPCSGKWNVWAITNFPGSAPAVLTNMTADGLHGDYYGVLAAGMGDPLKQETPFVPNGLFPQNAATLTIGTLPASSLPANGFGITNSQLMEISSGTSANNLYSSASGNFSYLALGYNGTQGAEIGYVGSAGQFFVNSLQGDFVNKEVTGSHYMRLGTGAGNSTLDLATGGGVATFNTNLVVSGNITLPAIMTTNQPSAANFNWSWIPPYSATKTNYFVGVWTNGTYCAIYSNTVSTYAIKQLAP